MKKEHDGELWIGFAMLALNILIWTGCQCPDWQKHLENLPLMGPVVGTEGNEATPADV